VKDIGKATKVLELMARGAVVDLDGRQYVLRGTRLFMLGRDDEGRVVLQDPGAAQNLDTFLTMCAQKSGEELLVETVEFNLRGTEG